MRQIFFKKQDLVIVIRRQGFFFFPRNFIFPLLFLMLSLSCIIFNISDKIFLIGFTLKFLF